MFRIYVTVLFLILTTNSILSRVPRDANDWEDYGSPPRKMVQSLHKMGSVGYNYKQMKLCNSNTSFSGGAFEGCMIGLSIGLVMGTLRAISLDGVPHAEDETPCKVLIGHVFGGFISGALIGLVHVFLTKCLFRVSSD